MISVRLRGAPAPPSPGGRGLPEETCTPRASSEGHLSQHSWRGSHRPQGLPHVFLAVSVITMILRLMDRAAAIFWLSFPCVSLCAGSHLSRYLKGVGISGDPCVSAGELPTQPVITFKDCFSGSWFYSPPMRLVPRPTPSLPVAPDQH